MALICSVPAHGSDLQMKGFHEGRSDLKACSGTASPSSPRGTEGKHTGEFCHAEMLALCSALVKSHFCEDTASNMNVVSNGGIPMAGFGAPGAGEEGHKKSASVQLSEAFRVQHTG